MRWTYVCGMALAPLVMVACTGGTDTSGSSPPSATDVVSGPVIITTAMAFDPNCSPDYNPREDSLCPTARGTFEVTIGAEALGCAQGTFTETFTPGAEPTSGLVEKTLTCESGIRSDTFSITFAYGQRYEGPEAGPGPGETPSAWTVTDTSGDFTGLTGQGTLTFSYVGYVGGQEEITGTIEYTP